MSKEFSGFKYWRPIAAASVALGGVSAYEYMQYTNSQPGETAEASPNFCDTSYKTIGDIKVGDAYSLMRAWVNGQFLNYSDVLSIRYDNPQQNLSQEDNSSGLWINRTSGADTSKPLEVQFREDPANLSQIKAGQDLAVLRYNAGWPDASLTVVDKSTGQVVGRVSADSSGKMILVLPENQSAFSVQINNNHPNSVEQILGNAVNSEISSNPGNILDLRSKLATIPSVPCPTATWTATSSATPTLIPIEARPALPPDLKAVNVNEATAGVWFNPMIWDAKSQQRLKLNNALDALRFSGDVLNLKQDDGQGSFFVNTKGEGDIRLDFQYDQRRNGDLLLNSPAAGIFIIFPNIPVRVEVVDSSDVNNSNIAAEFKTDSGGFGEIVPFNHVDSSNKRFSLIISGVNVPTAGRIYMGPISADRLAQYQAGQVTNGVYVVQQIKENKIYQIFVPVLPKGRLFGSEGTPVPTPTPTPESPKACLERGPIVDAVNSSEDIVPFENMAPNTFYRLDKWSWATELARAANTDKVIYSSQQAGVFNIFVQNGECDAEWALKTNPEFFSQIAPQGRATQHIFVTNFEGQPEKFTLQSVQADGPNKGEVVAQRVFNGYAGVLFDEQGSNLVRFVVRPYRTDRDTFITVGEAATNPADLNDPTKKEFQIDLKDYPQLRRPRP